MDEFDVEENRIDENTEESTEESTEEFMEESTEESAEESMEEASEESTVEYESMTTETIVVADNHFYDELNDLSMTGIMALIVVLLVISIALRRE